MQHGKIWGYVRVSTQEQSCDRQIKLLNEYANTHGLTIDYIFEEKASGKNFKDRPIWQSLKLTTMQLPKGVLVRLGGLTDPLQPMIRRVFSNMYDRTRGG